MLRNKHRSWSGRLEQNGDRRTTTAPRDQSQRQTLVKNVSRRAGAESSSSSSSRRRKTQSSSSSIVALTKSSSGDGGGALVSSSSKRRGFIASTRKAPKHFKNKNGEVFCGSPSGGIGGELSDSTTNNKNNNKTSNNGEENNKRWKSITSALATTLGEDRVEGEVIPLLERPLPPHEEIHRGTLKNGLKYVILPNTTPERRFEAHLEMHVGSVDEREDEQGLAHLVEHVTFLGSRKRDQYLGSGTRGNAYTDFHHTVFHIHAPTVNKDGVYMLNNVLDILYDVAFNPSLLQTRIQKEKKAVLAEAQMMNTIEYRVDCQLLQHLHWDNALGIRFPIGKLDQVPLWDDEKIRDFHARWYFPSNATLYVVGEFDATTEQVEKMIEDASTRRRRVRGQCKRNLL